MYSVLLRKPIENIVLSILETKNKYLADFIAMILRQAISFNKELNVHVDYDEDYDAFEEEFDG